MRKPSKKQQKLFDFLKQQHGKPFELEALIQATGYGAASAERSLGEHWRRVVTRAGSSDQKRWRTLRAFDKMSIDQFQQAITQSKRDPVVGRLKRERAQSLAQLARTQAHTAVELLNRPSLQSRVECFLLLILNSWELLLKSEVVEKSGWDAVFRVGKTKGKRHSLSFKELIDTLPSKEAKDQALRAQLTDLNELRNEAAHLLLRRPSRQMLHLFAGTVRSLSLRFCALTGSSLFPSDDLAGYLVLLGATLQPAHLEAVDLESEVDEQISANVERFGSMYAVPLSVRLRAVDDELASQVAVGPGDVLTLSTEAVRNTFRFKRDEVALRVGRMLRDRGRVIEVKPYHVDLLRKNENWNPNKENPFVTQFPAAKLYSEDACTKAAELIDARPDYFEVIKRKEKRRMNKARKSP